MLGRPPRALPRRWRGARLFRPLIAVMSLVATAAVGSAGCSRSDGPAPSASDAAGLERFCERAEQFSRTLSTVDASQVESFDVVAAQVDGLARIAPDAIAADLSVMNDYWQRLAAVPTDDAGALGTLEERDAATTAASQRVTAYLVDECGIQPPQ